MKPLKINGTAQNFSPYETGVTFNKDDSLGALQWPFDKPQYLILNIAAESSGVDDAILPQTMKINYVRVYQKPSKQNTS